MTRIRNEIDTGVFQLIRLKDEAGLSAKKNGLSFGLLPTAIFIGISENGLIYKKSEVTESLQAETYDVKSPITFTKISPKEVLDEINSKRSIGGLYSTALSFSVVCMIISLIVGLPIWFLSLELWAGAAVTYAVKRRDAISKITAIYYDFEGTKPSEYEQFCESIITINQCSSIWNFVTKGKVGEPKHNAGAQSQIDRFKASISKKLPPFIYTNVDIICLEFQETEIYFFPDRILVYKNSVVSSIEYSSLHLEIRQTRFVETWTLPSDANVIDKTWIHMNKSGGPDRRFRDNREIPICSYEMLEVTNFGGFQANLLLSKCGFAEPFVTSLRKYRETADQKNSTSSPIATMNGTNQKNTDLSTEAPCSNLTGISNEQKHIEPEKMNDIFVQFFSNVGPPKGFNFSAVEKGVPVGLKLFGLSFIESAFVKVEKSPGDSYGRICIQKYSSLTQAKADFINVLMRNMNTYVPFTNKSEMVGVEHFYSNQIDERYAFLGLSGVWIIHGVFPKRDVHEHYVEDLFSIDSTNEKLKKQISARPYTVQHPVSKPREPDKTSLPPSDNLVEFVQTEQESKLATGSIYDIPEISLPTKLPSENQKQLAIDVISIDVEEADDLATYKTSDTLHSELVPPTDLAIPKNPSSMLLTRPPCKPKKNQIAHWYSKDEAVVVHNYVIQVGMVFVGSKPIDYIGDIACLIDPSLPIAGNGDYRLKLMGYWPQYSQISPEARSAYLNWLATGKSDPEADIGYIFLYFYGLEKRYFEFIPSVIPSEFDMSEIYEELKRLRTIYGVKNKSFEKYLDVFLEIVRVTTTKEKLYELELPLFKRNENATSLYLRVLIGQAMRDRFPLDFQLVKFWIELDTKFNLSDIPTKLEAQSWFWHILEIDFLTKHPSGMIVPDNDSVLCIDYRPASPPWTSESSIAMAFDNVPDMATVSGLHKQLQSYIDSAAKTFEPLKKVLRYSRNTSTDELFFSLPAKYWKDSVRQSLKALLGRCIDSSEIIKGSEFNAVFETPKGLPKQIFTQVISQLRHTFGVDIVPSAEEFVVSPTSSDSLILYRTTNENNTISTNSDQYNQSLSVADSTVELAAFVAHADTVFSDAEFEYIVTKIDSWTDLVASDRLRFSLKLKLLRLHPRTLSSIKVKVNNLLPDDRKVIFEFIRDVVSVDGVNSQQAAQLVRNISSLLDMNEAFVIDPNVSTPLAGSELVDLTAKAQGTPRFTLDTEKIAELQKESRQISVMLGAIFEQEQTIDPKPVHDMKNVSTSIPTLDVDNKDVDLLKGLDKVHTQFLRTLVSRSEWTRADVEAVSRKLELMTDGAIELINDAAFEQFDMPLIEGDDPIEINLDLIENLPL